ncbi:hypothetical protein GCM10011332_30640 [Terasakiella brassicae]|uniref:Uncharacterized protein n=1 Tax=Terasakiella brassicae TaxID=1634917 RepID=A0A917C877_9PROT|nr:hypothetical protein [Terasakiella brassicae]GGF74388.1 hypothetical protein GCM10011332_30640 [Terasakiella brassicae]
MDDQKIKITIGIVPGRVEEDLVIVSGTTVAKALQIAQFSDVTPGQYSVRVDRNPASLQTALIEDCSVILSPSAYGEACSYSPTETVLVYFNGLHGVRKRKQEVDRFLLQLNAPQERIVKIIETDPRNRSCFLDHVSKIDTSDLLLVVYEMKDILHPAVRPLALKVKPFVVSEFDGMPSSFGNEDAFWHFVKVWDLLKVYEKSKRPKRKLSNPNLKDQTAAQHEDMDLWHRVKIIMQEPSIEDGKWLENDNLIAFELGKRYSIIITGSRFNERMNRLDKNEDGSRRGFIKKLTGWKKRNKKKNKEA